MNQQKTTQNSPSPTQATRSTFEVRPELWDARYSDKDRETLKVIAQEHGLNPLTREVIIIKGNVYVTATGLQKLSVRDPEYDGCEIEVVEADWERDFFVVKARVWKKDCTHPFEDFGDADPSTSSLRGHALFRHAITRARARAMRSAFAIPFCALEELDDETRWKKMQQQEQRQPGPQVSRRPRQWTDKNEKPLGGTEKPAQQHELIELATPEQHQQIRSFAQLLRISPEVLADDLMQQYGVPSWEKLSKMQAELLVELLQDRLGQQRADEPEQVQQAEVPEKVEEVLEVEAPKAKEEERVHSAQERLALEKPPALRPVRNSHRPQSALHPKPSRLEQQRMADECIRKMESVEDLQGLRQEWEEFQNLRQFLSAELIDRICQTKNERKARLSSIAA